LLRHWYGVAIGGLGWSPKTFWRATLAEFVMALDGHNQVQGSARGKPRPLSVAEQEELLAWDRERRL